MVFFRRCQERVSASADNMHYVKLNWYIFILIFIKNIIEKLKYGGMILIK